MKTNPRSHVWNLFLHLPLVRKSQKQGLTSACGSRQDALVPEDISLKMFCLWKDLISSHRAFFFLIHLLGFVRLM